MATETLTVTADLTPLDLLLWRRFKVETPGLLESTLDAQPGLAALGTYLPVGTRVKVEVPSPSASRQRPARQAVRLMRVGKGRVDA